MTCKIPSTFTWNATFFSVLVWTTVLFADSYGPYADFRQVDSTGQYYLVVRKIPGWGEDPGRGGRVRYALAKRKPGADPVTSEQNQFNLDKVDDFLNPDEINNPKVKVRECDTLLGQGILNRAPGQILISSTGQGFVTLDVFGYNFADVKSLDSLVIVSHDGVVQHRMSLLDIYTEEEISQFSFSAGGVFWAAGGWINEQQKTAVVVSVPRDTERPARIIRTVDLKSGTVNKASSDQIAAALKNLNRNAMPFSIELAIEARLQNCRPYLAKLYSSEDFSDDIRAYAAVGLALFGDMQGREFLREFVTRPSGENDDLLATSLSSESNYYSVEFAIDHLNEIFGQDAPQLLREIACKTDHDVFLQFSSTPARSIPVLIEMVKDKGCPKGQEVAVSCLGSLCTESAVPHLVKVFEKESNSSNNLKYLAAIALGEIGPPSRPALPHLKHAIQELELIIARGQDEWGGAEYKLNQYREAVNHIESQN